MPSTRPSRVQECEYLYPSGRTCRRIPKRGERLCRDHKRARRQPSSEDAAFYRNLQAWTEHLERLTVDQMAVEVLYALGELYPVLHSRLSRAHRLIFSRALLAIAELTERTTLERLARDRPAAQQFKTECLRAGIPLPTL